MKSDNQTLFRTFEENFSMRLNFFDSKKQVSNCMFNPHFHEQHELAYVSGGSIVYKIGKNSYTLKKGDCVLLSPYVVHKTSKIAELEIYVINFNKKYIDEFLNRTTSENLISKLPYYIYRNSSTFHHQYNNITYMIREMYRQYTEDESGYNNNCPYLLFAVLQFIARFSKPINSINDLTTRPSKKALTHLVSEYIKLHYNDITCLDDISNEFFITNSHLCKIFKKEFGCTVIQFINDLKVKNAIELFKNTDYSAKKVSEMVGFESSSYFTRVFKEKTGYAPLKYKKTLLDNN